MYSGISEIINAITGFIAGFSKLNETSIRSVKIFASIVIIVIGAFFFIKLFMQDALYSKVMNLSPITYLIMGIVLVFAYGWYSQQRTINAVLTALNQQKKKEKLYSEQTYEKTSQIEDSARDLTKSLIGKLNADVSTVEMLHNKDIFDGGVHCRYYSESYPSMRDEVFFDAKEYQRMPTSILPIVSYMEKNDYFFGDMKDLKKIDANYTKVVESFHNHHIALKFMHKKDGKPLGILTCTWRDGLGDNMPNAVDIEKEMEVTAAKLELLLDLE